MNWRLLKIPHTKLDHKVFLYHKGNINGVKADVVKLKDMFMSNNYNSHSRTVQDNWNLFRSSLLDSVSKHVPRKFIKSQRDLPWLNHETKNSMHHRKQLYNIAK